MTTAGTAGTRFLLVSSFQCNAAVPGCNYEKAVLRYDAVSGLFLGVHIPNIAGPYGMALQPQRETLLVVSRTDSAVYEYNARTGAFIRRLVSPGAEGLNSPQNILVAADRNLLVTSTQTAGNLDKFNGVLKFNGSTGAFMSPFVNGGSVQTDTCSDPKCLRGPNGMAFGPNGRLYVASGVANDDFFNFIGEYDGSTGAYMNKLDATELTSPIGLTIRPAGTIREGNVLVTSTYPTAGKTDDKILEFDKSTRELITTNGIFANSKIDPGPLIWGVDGHLLVAERIGHIATNYSDRIVRHERLSGNYLSVFTAANDTNIHFATAMFEIAFGFADGDYDGDGDADLVDFAAFQRCSGSSPTSACLSAFDDNLSGRIGDVDYVAFFQRFRGPRRFCTTAGDCADGNACSSESCVAGECTYSNVADGTPCADDLFCNGSEICRGGFCAPAPPCIDQAHCDETNNRCLPCINNAECDDGNPCTNDTCVLGTGCQHQNNTIACSDGNACTTNDRCSGGSCVGGTPPVCNDGNICTDDSCVPSVGCFFVHNTAPCSDGSVCTLQDHCLQGTCRQGDPLNCDDGNQCTDDPCNPTTGCSHTNNTGSCSDSNPCTFGDVCSGGVCRGTPVSCDDSVACTTDTCAAGVCSNTPNDGLCDNGLSCDGAEQCVAELGCRPGTPPNCNDGIACTTDGCDQVDGCFHSTNNGACNDSNGCTNDVCDLVLGCRFTNNSNPCNDGNACTQTDTCQAGSCVGGNSVVCTALDQCHDAGLCDAVTGACSNPEKNNGTACNDGNLCTQSDTCQAGTCTGSSPVVCTRLDQCHDAGTCNPSTGLCSNPNSVKGTACEDGNACTQIDICQDGSCVGSFPVECTALDQCHLAGTCDPATGVCSDPTAPNGTPCGDNSACTQTDTCQNGNCVGGNNVVCAASGQCHVAGTCDPATGLCSNPNAPNGTSCNDQDACTQTDSCQAGSCVGGNEVICVASDQCHDAGVCDPLTGLCSNPEAPNGTACDDGDACTQTDTCQAGSCVGGNSVVCTALDQCHDAGTCNPATGVCSNPNSAKGTPCVDGNACTQTDTCQDGNCVGNNSIVCIASDQCHVAGTCDPATGVCSDPNAPDGTPCGDSSACTQTDTCQAGSCVGGNDVICSASDQCHVAGVCDPLTGLCSDPEAPNGTACDDGDACTQTDTCQAGGCVGGNDVICVASDPCHDAGVCDPLTGLCSNPEAPNGTACDDGDACSQTDTCQAGSCVGGNSVVCTALDQCHDAGVCNTTTGVCSNPPKPDGTSCNDGDSCNQSDTCQSGACTGGSPVVCTALDQCHDAGTCNPATGVCSNPNSAKGIPCDDGNACTQTDTCQDGSCVGNNLIVCTPSDQCHVAGTCNPATGVCSDPNAPDGTPCGDGNSCTQTDTCQSGSCVGGGDVVCSASDQCHDAGVCDPQTGLCSNPEAPNGTACDDQDACTQTDTCQAGGCVGGNEVICVASDECHDAGLCDPLTGQCSDPEAPNGTACDDEDACTQTDTCQAGSCVGGNSVVCTALDQCHDAGVCNTTTGVCSDPPKPDGTSCNDGDSCTQSDTCQSGACTGANPIVCTALDQCHDAGVCNTTTGLCTDPPKSDGTSCNDGDSCTQGDTCQSGTCTGGSPLVCTALDQCHEAGVCNTTTGLCTDPPKSDGTSCSDGDSCTQGDTCQSGTCTGGSPVVCTALDQCHDAGTCNPATGVCSNPAKSNGTPCDDSLFCTVSDECIDGTCVGQDRVCQDPCIEDPPTCVPPP